MYTFVFNLILQFISLNVAGTDNEALSVVFNNGLIWLETWSFTLSSNRKGSAGMDDPAQLVANSTFDKFHSL